MDKRRNRHWVAETGRPIFRRKLKSGGQKKKYRHWVAETGRPIIGNGNGPIMFPEVRVNTVANLFYNSSSKSWYS